MKKVILSLGLAVATFVTVQAQDQPQVDPQTQPQDQQEMIEGEGIEKLDTAQIPQQVKDGIESSEFQGAEIAEAYVLSGTALDQQLGDQAVEQYIGDQYPEKLYQLRVSHENSPAMLYFTEEGELYASKDLEM